MSELYPFQIFGIAWLASLKVGVLADDMGLGKTVQAIVAAARIEARRILVIAPAIALDMWAREFAIWYPNRSVQIVRSSFEARNSLHGDVLIISYSLLIRVRAELCRICFDLLVCDEAQALKSIDAQRAKAVYAKDGGLIHCAKRIWLLSATLAPNHPGELWPHYWSLFGGKLTYQQYVQRYCLTKETSFGQQITGANSEHTAELADILRPFIKRRRLQEVLPDLPALRWGHIPVSPANVPPMAEISIEVAAILGKLERDEALTRVDQMALSTLRRWTGVAKAPSVVELLRAELDGGCEKIVCFAHHREVISTVVAGLGPLAAAINGDTPQHTRQALIDAFQTNATPRVLVLQLTVAGTALILHRSHRVVFAEQSWVPADMVQAAARCHRIGQRHSVLASVVSLSGSIDERVAAIVTRKAEELSKLEALISKESAA